MGEEEYSDAESSFLDNLHRQVSRTFDLALQHLEPENPVRDVIETGYLMCRTADTIEDDARLEQEVKVDLLGEYEQVLEDEKNYTGFKQKVLEASPYSRRDLEGMTKSVYYGHDVRDPDWVTVYNTPEIMESFENFDHGMREKVRKPVVDMTQGMKSLFNGNPPEGIGYDDGVRVETVEGLQNYCDIVAGTVGEMLTDVFTESKDLDIDVRDQLQENQEDFAYFLQFLNALKDVYSDYHDEGAIYIPEELLSENSSSHEDLEELLETVESSEEEPGEVIEREDTRKEEVAIEELAELTDSKAGGAFDYIETIEEHSEEVAEYLSVSFLLGKATHREVMENIEETFTPGDVKVDRSSVKIIDEILKNWYRGTELRLEEIDEIITDIHNYKLESEEDLDADGLNQITRMIRQTDPEKANPREQIMKLES